MGQDKESSHYYWEPSMSLALSWIPYMGKWGGRIQCLPHTYWVPGSSCDDHIETPQLEYELDVIIIPIIQIKELRPSLSHLP